MTRYIVALCIVVAAAATGFGGDRRLPRAATVERVQSCPGGVCPLPQGQPVVQAQATQYAAPQQPFQSFGGSGCQNGQCVPQQRTGPLRRLLGR